MHHGYGNGRAPAAGPSVKRGRRLFGVKGKQVRLGEDASSSSAVHTRWQVASDAQNTSDLPRE